MPASPTSGGLSALSHLIPLPEGWHLEGPTHLFGKFFCLIVEIGFHQSERIDAFHITKNRAKILNEGKVDCDHSTLQTTSTD